MDQTQKKYYNCLAHSIHFRFLFVEITQVLMHILDVTKFFKPVSRIMKNKYKRTYKKFSPHIPI